MSTEDCPPPKLPDENTRFGARVWREGFAQWMVELYPTDDSGFPLQPNRGFLTRGSAVRWSRRRLRQWNKDKPVKEEIE